MKINNIHDNIIESIKFGYLFLTLSILGLIYLIAYDGQIFWIATVSTFAIIILALIVTKSQILLYLYRLWMAFGDLLGRVVSPIVLGFIFFVLITPFALMGRIAGRDPLRLKARSGVSHWIKRDPPGPAPDSFKNQY